MSNTNIKKVRTSDLELKDRLVSIQRVTKVTKGGRTFSFSAIVVVGNEDGVVGYGLGKASEVQSAIAKGVEDAKKNLVKIPVINGTIPHKQESRFSGSLVMIRPAAPGTGVIAGGAMRAVLESVGVKNVLVLYTDVSNIKGDTAGRKIVRTTGEGKGLLLRDGVIESITWKRTSDKHTLEFYSENGQRADLSVGTTYINILDDGNKASWE